MFQFNYFEPKRGVPMASADRLPPSPSASADKVLLSWGEHCIECAAPDCYTSCDLYRPTETGKCRRFEGGIVRVKNGVDEAEAALVRFNRWGKLEAQGNALLIPPRRVDRIEKILGMVVQLANRLGAIAGNDLRWRNAADAIYKCCNSWLGGRRRHQRILPDQLIMRVENREIQPVRLLVSVVVDKLRLARQMRPEQLPPPVQHSIDVPSGLNDFAIDLGSAATIFGSGLPFNLAIAPLGIQECELVFHRLDLIARDAPVAAAHGDVTAVAKPAKLVIFDLDQTLWEGVLLEGEVRLRQGVAELLDTLDQRGILLSIASKNDLGDAMDQLKNFGIADYFLFPQIGWQQKSRSVQKIVTTINIGIDTIIFIDDNPFERSEVATAHPSVEIFDENCFATLADYPRLQGAVTSESRQRRSMYQTAITREQAQAGFDGDYYEFLRSCELIVTIRVPREKDHERIVELVQRTNQLNFSGRKYDRGIMAGIMADNRDKHVIECKDKFGEYGTVGFCISTIDIADDGTSRLRIHDLMMSCRVQGKQVERALLATLVDRSPVSIVTIQVDFRKTDRNRPAQLVLEAIGFSDSGADGGYAIAQSSADLNIDYLTVRNG